MKPILGGEEKASSSQSARPAVCYFWTTATRGVAGIGLGGACSVFSGHDWLARGNGGGAGLLIGPRDAPNRPISAHRRFGRAVKHNRAIFRCTASLVRLGIRA